MPTDNIAYRISVIRSSIKRKTTQTQVKMTGGILKKNKNGL